jgi:tetratricopeptide (TPR) repeat protein
MPIYVRSTRSAPEAELPFGLPKPPPGWPQKPPGISLCMIVKNEERFLGQALRSAHDVVDEIVVVDTGSTDRTIEIAKSFGATVLQREWRNDFAWARNQSLEPATKRWILFMDADEELLPQSKPALLRLKEAPAYRTAVWVRIFNKSDDYLGTGEMSHALIRIFPNDPEIRFRGMIHEFATVGGDVNGLPGVSSPIGIVHHGYVKDVVAERGKGARNLAIVRAATEKEPNEPYHWFNLGTTAFLVGDYETARDALEHMCQLVGGEKRGFVPNAFAVLAETYCDKLGDPVKGEAAARRGLEFAPHYANAHFQLGKALVAQGRFEEARAAYEAAIEDGKYAAQQFVIDDQVYIWKAHSEIGSSYVMQKDDDKALEWFERGLQNAPKAEPLHVNKAKALERLGRIEEAHATYKGVYELYRSEQSTLEYVNFLLRQHRENEAVAIVEECYRRFEPAKAVPLLMAAAAIAQRQKSPAVERYLREAADLVPGSAEVLDPLEAILRKRGKEQELAALIEREERTAPVAPADFARRARRAGMQGDNQRALQVARQGLALAPDDPMLCYTAAAASANLERNEEAWELLGRIRECPERLRAGVEQLRARLALKLSSLYLSSGRYADAAAVADQALRT